MSRQVVSNNPFISPPPALEHFATSDASPNTLPRQDTDNVRSNFTSIEAQTENSQPQRYKETVPPPVQTRPPIMLQDHQSDVDSSVMAQPNLIQFHILGEGQQQAEPDDALFENKYDMLDAYNKVLAKGQIDVSNRSQQVKDQSKSNESELRSNTDIDSPNRLRKIQMKELQQDVPTPNKLVDLSEVLDVNINGVNGYRTKGNKTKNVTSSGLSSHEFSKRVHSQQKTQRPAVGNKHNRARKFNEMVETVNQQCDSQDSTSKDANKTQSFQATGIRIGTSKTQDSLKQTNHMDTNINLREGSASNEVSSHRLNDQNFDPASSMEGSFRRIIDLN